MFSIEAYRISFNKRPQRQLNFETVRCDAYQREALISKLREMNNIKCESFVIFYFKIRMKHKTINKLNVMKKPKYKQYFHCFIVCILLPHAFWFSYQQNVVTILISATFRGAALIRGERAYLSPSAYQRKCDNSALLFNRNTCKEQRKEKKTRNFSTRTHVRKRERKREQQIFKKLEVIVKQTIRNILNYNLGQNICGINTFQHNCSPPKVKLSQNIITAK